MDHLRAGFLPAEMMLRDVLSQAFYSASPGCQLLLTDDGSRDLLGRCLHLVGVDDAALVDRVSAAPETLLAIGALEIWLRSTRLGTAPTETLKRLQAWAGRRTVGDLRTLLKARGIALYEWKENVT